MAIIYVEKSRKKRMSIDESTAIEIIKDFDFIAFEHYDLQNYLIQETQCDWNILKAKIEVRMSMQIA